MPRVQVFSASLEVNPGRGIQRAIDQLTTLDRIAIKVESTLNRLSSVSINFRTAETQIDKFKAKVSEIGQLSGQELVIGKGGGLFDSPIRALEEFALAFRDTFGDLDTLGQEGLRKATDEAAASIGVLSTSVTKVLEQMAQRNPRIFKFIEDDARRTEHEVVGGSIIPDMIDAIEREFQRMPPAFHVQSEKLKREVQEIGKFIEREVRDDVVPNISDSLNSLKNAQDAIENAFIQTATSSKRLIAQIVAGLDLTKPEFADLSSNLNQMQRTIESSITSGAFKKGASDLSDSLTTVKVAYRDLVNRGVLVVGSEEEERYAKAIEFSDKLTSSIRREGVALEASTQQLRDAQNFFKSLSQSVGELGIANISVLPKSFQEAFGRIKKNAEDAAIGKDILKVVEITKDVEHLRRVFDTEFFDHLKASSPVVAEEFEDEFKEALDKIDRQLNVFPQVEKSISRVQEIQKELRKLSDLSREFAGISKDEFTKSDALGVDTVRDSFLELESGIRNLKTKFSPEVIAFRQDLIKFREEWKTLGKVGGTSIEDLQNHMRSLTATFEKLQDADAAEALQKSLDKIEASQQKSAQKQEARDAQRQANINRIVSDIQAINEAGQQTESTFSRVSEGLSLAFTTPGARLEGLREAIFGTAASTNVLARGFDFLIGRGNSLGAIENRLIASASELAIQVSHGTASLKDQANEFRKLTQAELGNVNVSEEFNKRLTKLAASLDQVVVTAESGGDISRSLIRANTEVRRLEDQYSRLISSGLLPVGSKSREVFNSMIKQARDQQRAVQAIAVRYQANEQALEKAKAKQEEMNASTEKSTNIFTRFRLIFGRGGGIFGQLERDITINTGLLGKIRFEFVKLFGIVSKDSKKAAQGVDQINQSLSRSQKAVNVFKSVFLGAFSGTAIGTIFSRFIPDSIDNLVFGIINKIQGIPAALVQSASDAAETQNKFEAVFDDLTGRAEAFVQQLATDVGRDPFALKDGLSSIQAFSIGLGFLPNQAFDFSTSITSASLDLASFYNLSDSEALDRIRAALAGSGEVLDQYGINLREAALEQEALRLGINKSSADLTEQEKVLLRWSIIQNAMTKQGAMGDAVNTAASFSNQMKAMSAQVSQFGVTIGTIVLPVVAPFLSALRQLAQDVFPVVISVVQSATTAIKPFTDSFAAFIGNLGKVDYAGIFGAVLSIIDDLTGNIGANITSLIDVARDWGSSFMGELGQGILDAAGDVLDAVIDIASQIASFLAPGSPPEKGPLNRIDEWGRPLTEMFTDGMVQGLETDRIKKALNPVASLMGGQTGPLSSLLKQRQDLLDRLRRASELGLDTTFLNQQLEDVQGQIEQFQNAAVDAKSASKFLPDNLTGIKGKSFGEGGGGGGGGSDRAPKEREGKETFQEKFAREKTALEERRKAGLISQSEFLKEMLKLEKDYVEDSQKEGITAGLEEHVAAIKSLNQQAHAAELNELQARFDSGIISQEEYTKGLLKIDEKYAEDKLALGEQLSADEIKNIQDLQAEVESFKKKGGAGGVDQSDTLFAKIFGTNQEGEIKAQVTESVSRIADTAVTAISDRIKARFTSITTRIGTALVTSFSEGFNKLQAYLISLTPEQIFPLSILLGPVAAPIVFGLFNVLDDLFKLILRFPKGLGAMLKFLGPIVGLIGRWSVAGVIVIGTIQQWDEIVAEFGPLVIEAKNAIDGLISTISTMFGELSNNELATQGINNILASISKLGFAISLTAGFIIGMGKKVLKIVFVGGLVKAIEAVNNFITAFGGAEEFAKSLSGAIAELGVTANNVTDRLVNGLIALFKGDFDASLQFFTSIPNVLEQSLSTGLTSDFLGRVKTTISKQLEDTINSIFSLLPQNIQDSITSGLSTVTGIGESITSEIFGGEGGDPSPIIQTLIDAFDRLKVSFQGFLNQGRLGGEFLKLFDALKQLGTTIAPQFLVALKAIGIATGVFLAIIIDVVASIAIAVVDTLPFVIQAFSGVVQIITGIVQGVTGFVALIRAGWAFITGDSKKAGVLFQQAVSTIGQAISNVFGGIVTVVSNVGLGILTFASSFFLNLVGLALSVIPGFENVGAQVLAFKDYVIGLFTTLSTQVMATINNLVTLAPEVFSIMVDKVIGFFANLYTELVGESIIPDLVNDVISWFTTLVTQAPQMVLDLVDSIIETFNDALDALEDIGRNIIEGLVKGLKNNAHLVLEFIKSLITDDIINAIKSRLGIFSPSIVMADLGEDTMKGFLQGMENVAPKFSSFIGSQTKELTKAFFPIVGANKQIHKDFSRIWRQSSDKVITALSDLESQGNLTAETMENTIEGITGKTLFGRAAERVRAAAPGFIAEFRKLREGALRAFHAQEIERGLGILDTTSKLVGEFDKKLQELRGTALTSKNILENMLGKDLSTDEITNMANTIIEAGGARTDEEKAILDAANAQDKFNAGLEQQKRIQEQVLKLEQQRSKLDFIKTQLQLLEQAKANNLGPEIIAGLQLGADTPIDKVLEAMGKVTQAIIDKAQKDLQISSPSGVFKDFGNNITTTLADTLKTGSSVVARGMQFVTDKLVNVPALDANLLSLQVPNRTDLQNLPLAQAGQRPIQVTYNVGSNMDLAMVKRQTLEVIQGIG
jgi:phage-related protein